MKTNFFLLLLSILILSGISCKKEEGEGGTATISGKVFEEKWDNTNSLLENSYPARDEDVYILYGDDNTTYDKDYKTSYDGSYEFKYLQKGTYKLYVYTEDTAGLAANGTVDFSLPKVPVFATVEITDKGQSVSVPDLIIKTFK